MSNKAIRGTLYCNSLLSRTVGADGVLSHKGAPFYQYDTDYPDQRRLTANGSTFYTRPYESTGHASVQATALLTLTNNLQAAGTINLMTSSSVSEAYPVTPGADADATAAAVALAINQNSEFFRASASTNSVTIKCVPSWAVTGGDTGAHGNAASASLVNGAGWAITTNFQSGVTGADDVTSPMIYNASGAQRVMRLLLDHSAFTAASQTETISIWTPTETIVLCDVWGWALSAYAASSPGDAGTFSPDMSVGNVADTTSIYLLEDDLAVATSPLWTENAKKGASLATPRTNVMDNGLRGDIVQVTLDVGTGNEVLEVDSGQILIFFRFFYLDRAAPGEDPATDEYRGTP